MTKHKKSSPLKMQQIVTLIVGSLSAVLESNKDHLNELGKPRPQINDLCSTSDICRPEFLLEKHMSVLRNGPTMPLSIEMYQFEDQLADINTVSEGTAVSAVFYGNYMDQSANYNKNPDVNIPLQFAEHTRGRAVDGTDISMFYTKGKVQKKVGDKLIIPIDISKSGEDWEAGDQLMIKHEYTDIYGNEKLATCRCEIINPMQSRDEPTGDWVAPEWSPYSVHTGLNAAFDPTVDNATRATWGAWNLPGDGVDNFVHATVMSMSGDFPISAYTHADVYSVDLVQIEPLFKVKFPKFSYRYKYENGEYSVFAPWSEVAFIPGQFDYSPKKAKIIKSFKLET